jgi:hypothetical protein
MGWFKKHKILTILLILILLGVGASAASGSSNQKTGTASNGNTKSSQKTYRFADRADKQSGDVELSLNETGTIDGMKLSVTGAEYKTSLGQFDEAGDGNTYVVTTVQLENTSDRTKPYNPYEFRVQTPGGQVLDPAISSVTQLNAGDLVTGGKVSGNIVFKVPTAGEGHEYLIWKPGISSQRAVVQLR